MKKVILLTDEETIVLNDIRESEPIFVKLKGKLIGMVIKENLGWIIRVGGDCGAFGYSCDRTTAISKGIEAKYEFFVENV